MTWFKFEIDGRTPGMEDGCLAHHFFIVRQIFDRNGTLRHRSQKGLELFPSTGQLTLRRVDIHTNTCTFVGIAIDVIQLNDRSAAPLGRADMAVWISDMVKSAFGSCQVQRRGQRLSHIVVIAVLQVPW